MSPAAVALFPADGGGADLVSRAALARARLGWPAAMDFNPPELAAEDCDRIAEMAEGLARAIRSGHGAPAQHVAELGREIAGRALRVMQVGAMCGGRP